jgi:hypothetical protein
MGVQTSNDNKLVAEIEAAQRAVSTDQYPMSIGELASMYRDKEIILNPKFQRVFRWSLSQKSALVESILIGIPVPPIFCYEREDSKWEIIDGLQRVSTILEFMGVLHTKSEGQADVRPDENRTVLRLSDTEYLPSLRGACWEDGGAEEGGFGIPASLQIAFKRAKIGIQIIKKTSAPNTKYDLFQRLNSNGSPLTPQEYRSCILVMINERLFDLVAEFSKSEEFRGILRLDNEDMEKQNDIDYACRLITHCFFEYERRDKDIDEFISDSVKQVFLTKAAEIESFLKCAGAAIGTLWRLLGEDALRRQSSGRAVGKAGRVGFETVAVGAVANWAAISAQLDVDSFLRNRVMDMWTNDKVNQFSSPGLRGTDRIKITVPFGKSWFKP